MTWFLFKSQRFLKITQLIIGFASITAAADASWSTPRYDTRPGHYAPGETERDEDRRFGDLARMERKRREDAQRRCCRSKLEISAERTAPANGLHAPPAAQPPAAAES